MKRSRFPLRTLFACAVTALSPVAATQAAVIYGTPGAAYTQSFDTLASSGSAAWANDSTLAGWYWQNFDDTTPANYLATAGSESAQGQILSLGNSADRAFGGQNPNGISTLHYGVQIRNATGSTLDSFSLSYTGEQWRKINENGTDKLTFEYQVFDSSAENPLAATTGWTTVSSLDFTDTVTANPSIGGSLFASQDLEGTATGIAWGEGQDLWLRWSDNNPANNNTNSRRAMMGIDDVYFTAVPEPGASLLLGVSALLYVLRRRR